MSVQTEVRICGATQTLKVLRGCEAIFSALISTARRGFGEVVGSEQTPRGWHEIAAKIGAGLPINAVLVARNFTGEIYNQILAEQYPERDWILTRILWLAGMDAHNKNSQARYIYVHGTPESNPMGLPLSHGCIRMRNEDILQLFDLVTIGTKVFIEE
jgi:hypothetical protein